MPQRELQSQSPSFEEIGTGRGAVPRSSKYGKKTERRGSRIETLRRMPGGQKCSVAGSARQCGYIGCASGPTYDGKFYKIYEHTKAGGQDWTNLWGAELCKGCYERFRQRGTLEIQRRPAPRRFKGVRQQHDKPLAGSARQCGHMGCASGPTYDGQLYLIDEHTDAGGQDWTNLLGTELCKGCYERFRHRGSLEPGRRRGRQPHEPLAGSARQCGYMGCDGDPTYDGKLYLIDEHTKAGGGHNWKNFQGAMLCQHCYELVAMGRVESLEDVTEWREVWMDESQRFLDPGLALNSEPLAHPLVIPCVFGQGIDEILDGIDEEGQSLRKDQESFENHRHDARRRRRKQLDDIREALRSQLGVPANSYMETMLEDPALTEQIQVFLGANTELSRLRSLMLGELAFYDTCFEHDVPMCADSLIKGAIIVFEPAGERSWLTFQVYKKGLNGEEVLIRKMRGTQLSRHLQAKMNTPSGQMMSDADCAETCIYYGKLPAAQAWPLIYEFVGPERTLIEFSTSDVDYKNLNGKFQEYGIRHTSWGNFGGKSQICGMGQTLFGVNESLVKSPGAGLSPISKHLHQGHGPGGYTALGELDERWRAPKDDATMALELAAEEAVKVTATATVTPPAEETTPTQQTPRVVGYQIVTDVSVEWSLVAYFSDEMVDVQNLCNLFFGIKLVLGDFTVEQYVEMAQSQSGGGGGGG